jgi:hypothetical protein
LSSLARFFALNVLFTLGVSAQVIYFDFTEIGFFARGSWESQDPNVKTDNLMGRPHVFTSYLDVIKWDDGLIATAKRVF